MVCKVGVKSVALLGKYDLSWVINLYNMRKQYFGIPVAFAILY